MRPAKILIRLRIRTVWSESSLGALMQSFFMPTNMLKAQSDLSLYPAHMSEGTLSYVYVVARIISTILSLIPIIPHRDLNPDF